MDSLNTADDHHRLINVEAYLMYCLFLWVMYLAVWLYRDEASKKSHIAFILYLINFFAVWFVVVEDCNPMAFYVIFFTTMIAIPGVLIYELDRIHQRAFSTDETYLLM